MDFDRNWLEQLKSHVDWMDAQGTAPTNTDTNEHFDSGLHLDPSPIRSTQIDLNSNVIDSEISRHEKGLGSNGGNFLSNGEITGVEYVCQFTGCGRSFLSKSKWCKDQKSHGIKPYRCDLPRCESKAFFWKSGLARHLNTSKSHGRSLQRRKLKKPCKWSGCTWNGTSSSEVLEHERLKHTMEMPYKCDLGCGEAFASKRTLFKHKHRSRSHSNGEFKCLQDGCAFVALHKYLLSRHQKIHAKRDLECSSAEMHGERSTLPEEVENDEDQVGDDGDTSHNSENRSNREGNPRHGVANACRKPDSLIKQVSLFNIFSLINS